MLVLLFWLSLAILAYVYVGYPLLLRAIVALRGPRPIGRRDITPHVSLVISAYNEAAIIRQKLMNALALDYPPASLEIVVISDASTDGTDRVVESFAARGVRLIRRPHRRGKTAGLNYAVPRLQGEIVVFSDANAMYQPDAIRKLVRNFADPAVGCVTGEARYIKMREESAAQLGERAYWDYEIQQKRLETAIGSMVGGDGAIYAIRASLWQPLPESAINDFLNPLQIVCAGWRAVYEPEAICYEETAGGASREYGRRVRIVSRSWRAVFQAPGVLNPFRVGFFTLSVVSHKMLRWWSGLFASVVVVVLLMQLGALARSASAPVLVAATILGAAALALPSGRRAVSLAGYFATINAASLVGIFQGSLGRVSGTWRQLREQAEQPVPAGERIGWVVALVAVAAMLIAAAAVTAPRVIVSIVFWVAVGALVYVYAAYPLLISSLAVILRRDVGKRRVEPSVALLIVANDEGAVIEAKLLNALAIDYPRARYRIVVASDGSVDGTNDIVRRFAADGVELLAFPERRGKMATLNAAVAALGSVEVVVFSDANVFLQPSAVRELVANLADPTVGAVSGDVILVGDRASLGSSEDLYYRYERWLQRTESAIGSMIGVDGALYALKRTLFVPPPPDTILDDIAIPMAVLQQGYRVVFEPAALAVEQGSQSALEEFSRKSRVIAGAAQFLLRGARHIPLWKPQILFSFFSHKVLRWLSPGAGIATLACAAVLAADSRAYLAVAGLQATVLLVGLAGCHAQLRRIPLIGFAHYYCLVQAAAAVGFVRGLFGLQPTAWQRFARAPVDATVAPVTVRTEGVL